MKPISANQYLLLGFCFWGFAIAQAIVLVVCIIEPYKNQARESGIKSLEQVKPWQQKEVKPWQKVTEDSPFSQQSHDAENVLKMFGIGGGLCGLVMISLAASKDRRDRKQAKSNVA